MIDGTSVMVQPSISRTYTFIIYYPRRYGYFASGTSCFSLPPPLPPRPTPPRCCFLLVATPDASAKPKGRPVTKQPFPRPSVRPSVHGFVLFDLRSILASNDFRKFRKIRDSIRIENLKRKFPLFRLLSKELKLIVLLQLHHTPLRSSLFTHTDAQHEGDDFRILATSLSPLLRHETNALSAQSSSWFPPVRMTTIRMTITIEDDDSSQLSILARGGRAKLETRFSSRGNLRTDRNSSNAPCFAI